METIMLSRLGISIGVVLIFVWCVAAADPVEVSKADPDPDAIPAPLPPEGLPFVYGHSTIAYNTFPYEQASDCIPLGHPCGCPGHHSRKAYWQRHHWGYPEEFCERPFGSMVRSALNAQVTNGLASQMSLYEYDFDGPMLTARGRIELQRIAERMQRLGAPIVIEATNEAQLDQQRRITVIEQLLQLGMPVTEEFVLVRSMIRPGLNGVEARTIFENLLQQTTDLGATISGSSDATQLATPPAGLPVGR
jgi:hypothetical protein